MKKRAVLILLALAGPVYAGKILIPGLEHSTLSDDLSALVLIEELNCASCHRSEAPFAARSKKAPRLSLLGARVNPHYLQSFIAHPHQVKPGTTMPDVMAHLPAAEKKSSAEALTHFLLSLKKNDFAPQAPDAVAAAQGEKLFHSRGCVACHSPRDASGKEVMAGSSAPLGALEKKYSFRSLVDFLRRPHASRPSARMPDMRLQGRDLEQIAHYLLRETRVPGHLAYTLHRGQVWEGLDSDQVKAERAGQVKDFSLESLGKVHHQTAIEYRGWLNIERAGDYVFHARMNGGSLKVDGRALIGESPSNRRGTKKFKGETTLGTGWKEIALTYFHTGRDPKFALEWEGPGIKRQPIPSERLSISDQPVPAFKPLRVAPALAARGRELFATFGCAKCHDDLKVKPLDYPAFADLTPNRGCLGEQSGPWPRFDLDPDQRAGMTKLLPRVEALRLDDQQQVDKTLVTFNCIGCHDRTGVGGVAPERDRYFTGTRPELGNQGRIPPPLSHVGAKLTPAWITEVLLRGQRQRVYLDANMPQYGEAQVGHLVERFGKVDQLEEVTFPTITNIRETKHAGYEMMGTSGFSCIACHDYNGQRAGGAGALDIVHVTQRVRKNWFHLYMRQPSRFHPAVIMPSYWPGGQSVRKDVLDGNRDQQIEALWTYLQDGPRAKKPKGLSRQSSEIRVTDVAEICRGRGTAGYRGIGVGYPERISLAFDSEQMALRQLWKGAFAQVNHGSFHARGSDRISFPPGIPFHRLASMDDHWPYKGKTDYAFPHDHGYQFRGYRLDPQRRPTFRYHYGDIAVEDFFEDVMGKDGAAYFKRTLTFTAPAPQKRFYFRAAAGKQVVKKSDGAFDIERLKLRITSEHGGEVREGDPAEVLIPLTLPRGTTILSLEYQW